MTSEITSDSARMRSPKASMAWHSGRSSITTSTVTSGFLGEAPTTRSSRSPGPSRLVKAAWMCSTGPAARRSWVASISRGVSRISISLPRPGTRTATEWAPTWSSSSPSISSLTIWSGVACSASTARWALAM